MRKSEKRSNKNCIVFMQYCTSVQVLYFYSVFSHYSMAQFRSLVHKVFSDQHSQSLPVDSIMSAINIGLSQPFLRSEVDHALDTMQEANQVMVSEGMVFLI